MKDTLKIIAAVVLGKVLGTVVFVFLLWAFGSCAATRPVTEPSVDPVAIAVPLDSLAQLPAYLVPAPAGSTARQKRQWQKAQTANLARAGVLPTTVKIKHSAVATGTGSVALTKPQGAVAVGPDAVATTVTKPRAAVAVGEGAHLEAVLPQRTWPWWLLVILVMLVLLNRLVRGRWLL